jgi:hypothetical protein
VIVAVTLVGWMSYGQSPDVDGRKIMAEAMALDTGWGDWSADLTMTLRNRNGNTSDRRIRASFLEVEGDGVKSLIVFQDPPDVKGSALLTYAHPGRDDDQWLYLPAVKQAKRIASVNKSGPFMGSEFAYEDLAAPDLEKYTYAFLREEILEGEAAQVIERIPADKNSGYTRQIVWLHKETGRLLRVEFYDRKNVLLKTLEVGNYLPFESFWRAGYMEMTNAQTGRSTRLEWDNIVIGQGLSERDFDQSALRRAR